MYPIRPLVLQAIESLCLWFLNLSVCLIESQIYTGLEFQLWKRRLLSFYCHSSTKKTKQDFALVNWIVRFCYQTVLSKFEDFKTKYNNLLT